MTRWPLEQAGHRVKGVLQVVPCGEAAVGQAGGHPPVGRRVFAFDEDTYGQVEGKDVLGRNVVASCSLMNLQGQRLGCYVS